MDDKKEAEAAEVMEGAEKDEADVKKCEDMDEWVHPSKLMFYNGGGVSVTRSEKSENLIIILWTHRMVM